MDQQYYKSLDKSTPVFADFSGLFDADDELRPIATKLLKEGTRNLDIDPTRIKFLYSDKPKKIGTFTLFEVIKRPETEKMCNPDLDLIMTVFYDVWSQLDGEHKVIALDKALCSIQSEEEKVKKVGPDSMEYKENMHRFGPDKVMRASETINFACENAIAVRKQKAKDKKKAPVLDDVIGND